MPNLLRSTILLPPKPVEQFSTSSSIYPSLVSQGTLSRPLVCLFLSCFVGPLIRAVVNHHLRQRLHGRRNLPRYIAVYRCQQILILIRCPLFYGGWLALGSYCGLDRLFSGLVLQCGFLLCRFYRRYPRQLLPLMAF